MSRSRPAHNDPVNRFAKVAVGLWVFGALFAVAFWGTVIYIVLHFLMKWW